MTDCYSLATIRHSVLDCFVVLMKGHRTDPISFSKFLTMTLLSSSAFTASRDVTRIKRKILSKEELRDDELPCTSREAKARHEIEKTRKEMKIQKCKDCTYVCNNREELKAHRNENHSLLIHICMSCGESYPTAQALGRHTRKCTPSNPRERKSITNIKNAEEEQETLQCDECNFR